MRLLTGYIEALLKQLARLKPWRRPTECANCNRVLEWIRLQGTATTDKAEEFHLPSDLASIAARGTAIGLRTADGRHFALVKTWVGWKDNFEGILCCDAPLRDHEVIGSAAERPYISIDNVGAFEELYIRKCYSPVCCSVFFDLN